MAFPLCLPSASNKAHRLWALSGQPWKGPGGGNLGIRGVLAPWLEGAQEPIGPHLWGVWLCWFFSPRGGGDSQRGQEALSRGQQPMMQMRVPGGCRTPAYSPAESNMSGALVQLQRGSQPCLPLPPPAPRPHPSLAFTRWSLFPAVRIMNLHELIM